MIPSDGVGRGGLRPTSIGPFNARVGETSRTRTIPVPWVDCDTCSLRHYPSTTGGRWHIATMCMSCGAALEVPVDAVSRTGADSEVAGQGEP